MLDQLQSFTTSLPTFLQWLGILIAGAIPFIESYWGSAIGVAAGVHPFIAVVAAIIGNIATMLLLVLGTSAVRDRFSGQPRELTGKKLKLRNAFDRYGVATVSLLGQVFLPSQITSSALVSFGASKSSVVFWQLISIILWGVAFGTLAVLGVDFVANR